MLVCPSLAVLNNFHLTVSRPQAEWQARRVCITSRDESSYATHALELMSGWETDWNTFCARAGCWCLFYVREQATEAQNKTTKIDQALPNCIANHTSPGCRSLSVARTHVLAIGPFGRALHLNRSSARGETQEGLRPGSCTQV